MTTPNGIKAIIEKITENEVFLRIHGELKSFPKSLIKKNTQPGEEMILKLENPQDLEQETEAHYQAMKKVLKDLVQ